MGNTEQVAEPLQPPPPPLAELIASLEQATLMAKQIGVTVEQTQLLQIYSSLHHSHAHLSAFLSSVSVSSAAAAADNSLSSATGFAEPMQLGEEEEENSALAKVEERMRECFIKNKRAKRPLSPSAAAATAAAAAEDRRVREDGFDLDPHGTKLRALDLVYQFHG